MYTKNTVGHKVNRLWKFDCLLHEVDSQFGWRRGSVVRTSVSGWQNFPDLCLICGWHVTTS